MFVFHTPKRAHKDYTFVLSVIYNNQHKVWYAGQQNVIYFIRLEKDFQHLMCYGYWIRGSVVGVIYTYPTNALPFFSRIWEL